MRSVGDVRRVVVWFFAAVVLLVASAARAEVSVAKGSDWELYTQGRVNAFLSTGFGDAHPLTIHGPNELNITPGGGLDTDVDVIPRTDAGGNPIQGTFRSMRLRSGFVPNVFAVGLRGQLTENTTYKIYVAFWMTIEAEGQRKFNNPFAYAREGYGKLEGPWGGLLVGRALDLFSRGATENEFLYGHGFGLGYPGNVADVGPAAGMIGFGVLAAFFASGIQYSTPMLAGLQLNVGVFDPVVITGYYPGTREPLFESEATYDFSRGRFKLHLFGNGAYQRLYLAASNTSATMDGVGYGGRLEFGPFHLGFAGHYGNGLGLSYALENSATSISQNNELRRFDGYSVQAQLQAKGFDFNLGWGISRVFLLQSDRDSIANCALDTDVIDPMRQCASLIKRQIGYSAAVVYHIRDRVHLDLDYLRGDFAWFLGEKQTVNFINAGVTVTW
jgi:hypothetical protein